MLDSENEAVGGEVTTVTVGSKDKGKRRHYNALPLGCDGDDGDTGGGSSSLTVQATKGPTPTSVEDGSAMGLLRVDKGLFMPSPGGVWGPETGARRRLCPPRGKAWQGGQISQQRPAIYKKRCAIDNSSKPIEIFEFVIFIPIGGR